MSTIKLGLHILGLKGTIDGRKGYIVHIDEPTETVWIRMESGEIVTDVPRTAFGNRRGRPATIHSVVGFKRVVYSEGMAPSEDIIVSDQSAHPDAEAYIDQPPTDDEFGTDEDPMALDADGWDEDISTKQEVSASKPKLKLVGQDGNAFFILGMFIDAGKKAGWTAEQVKAFKDDAMSSDYDHLLQVVCKHFDVS